MSDTPEGETIRLGDLSFSGPNLDVPNPPPGTPYERYEDFRAQELLRINGIDLTEAAVVAALESQSGVLLAAAAHTAGSKGLQSAVGALQGVVSSADDQAAVEAAYALVRLGRADAKDALVAALARPSGVYLSPLLAAGYLAQTGDPAGFPTVREGLASELSAMRMLACKQLYFFVPLQGAPLPTGDQVDALGAFSQALDDPDTNVQWQALAQLDLLRAPETRPLLERYAERAGDDGLRRVARDTLDALSR